MSAWPNTTLASVTRAPQYGAIASGTDAPVGPRFVRQTDIASGRIDWSSVPYCDLDPSDFEKYALHRGDLLISRLGNGVGNAATVHEPNDAVFAGYLVRFQAEPSEADPDYLGYTLQSQGWHNHVASYRSGAAQPTLNAKQMGAFELPLPPLPEQRVIAATLRTLDDKVESNRRAVEITQELADALFANTASVVRPLSDVATITMGSSPKGNDLNEAGEGLPFYQGTRDFRFRFPALRVWTTAPVRTAAANDTLMSVRAPVGDLNRAKADCCIGRGVAAIHSEFHPSTIYYAMRNSASTWDKFQGDGTVFASVNKTDVHRSEIRWVREDEASELESELATIDARIESLESESQRLAALRDALLPELLSGRIRVTAEGAA